MAELEDPGYKKIIGPGDDVSLFLAVIFRDIMVHLQAGISDENFKVELEEIAGLTKFQYFRKFMYQTLLKMLNDTYEEYQTEKKLVKFIKEVILKIKNQLLNEDEWESKTIKGEGQNIANLMFDYNEKTKGKVFKGADSLERSQLVVRMLTDRFNTAMTIDSKKLRKTKNYYSKFNVTSTERWVRTPLIASPAFAASLADVLVNKNPKVNTFFMPADADFPEVPISVFKLDLQTRHSSLRVNGVTDAERTYAREPENLYKHAHWVTEIGDKEHNGIRNATFVSNINSLHIGHMSDRIDFAGKEIGAQTDLGQGIFEKEYNDTSIGYSAFSDVDRSNPRSGVFSSRDHHQLKEKKKTIDFTNSSLDPSSKRAFSQIFSELFSDGERLTSATFQDSWNGINEITTNPLEKALIHIYEALPITKQALYRFAQHNIVVPINFLVTRPHMTYRTLFAIKCLAGREMGSTYYRPGLFEIGNDAKVQGQFGSFTFYMKAIVKQPKHVRIAKHIYLSGYVGGTGVVPIHPDSYVAGKGDYTGQSIIVLALPYSTDIKGIFSLTGTLTLGEHASYSLEHDGSIQYETAVRYNKIWGWNAANQGESYESSPWDGVSESMNNNVLCHQGHQFMFDGKHFRILKEGQGHFGKNTYLGRNKVSQGLMERFETPDWAGYVHA